MKETSTAPAVRVPWKRLRAWIDDQEDYERSHNRPVALSQAQLEALSVLIAFDEEPDVGDRDHVSLLLHETQNRRLSAPVFTTPDEPVLVPVRGHLQPKWSFACVIENYGAFPRELHGFDPGQQPPAFQSKKNAKRFAAKCALQYLQQMVPKTGAGAGTRSRVPCPSPARKIAAPAASAPLPSPSPAPSPAPSPDRSPGVKPQPSPPPAPEEQLVFQHVSELAKQLNIGVPRYEVAPDDEMPGFFRGYPVFAHADMVPPGLGVVTGVLGKKQAKLHVAEKVLEWLEEEKRKRRQTFDDIFRAKSSEGPTA